ncbi:MAG TPA: hypothetical protein VKN99_00140 [Polyangia bacterium]|nr:hypothetical protein [Polyangia bacterium]
MLPTRRRLLVAVSLAILGRAGAVSARAVPPTVGIDMTALDEATFQRLDALALEKRLVLRLVEEGFAVVAVAARPQAVLRVRPAADAVVLTVEAGQAGVRERRVPVGGDNLTELHLEIVQKAAELVRAAELARAAAPAAPPAGVVEAESAHGARVWLAVAGGADAVVRSGGVDAWPRIDLATGRGLWALHLEAGLAPSSGAGVDVREWSLLGGAGWRALARPRLTIEIGARAGVLLHTYDLADPTATDRSGLKADFLATLPASATYWIAGAMGLELRVAPGATTEAREHVAGNRILWQRGAIELAAGVALVWRVRGAP